MALLQAELDRLRVLIVDDDALVCRALVRSLGSAHELVAQSIGAEAAIERLEAGERFDLILSDITMAHLDGLGFLRSAQCIDAGLVGRIVLMSGAARPDIARQLDARTGPILVKPIRIETVRALAGTFRRRSDG